MSTATNTPPKSAFFAATAAANLPQFMRAAQGKDYGSIDEMLSVEEQVKVPRLSDLSAKDQSSHMIIKTLAVALAPGDCRVLSGLTRELQGPPAFPYIPGGDCCGRVIELPENPSDNNKCDLPFKVGDIVAVRFNEKPMGCLGEYALVSTNVADKVRNNISPQEAAALVSASPSTLMADSIRAGERVLVLGARGGEGSHLVQHVKRKGAALVVGVSCDPEGLLKAPLSVDKAIDYTKEDVFSMKEYQDEPFDTIIDLASGGWPQLMKCIQKKQPLIVKTAANGGRYITPTPDVPIFEAHSVWQILKIFLFPAIHRAIVSRLWRRWSYPKYTYAMAIPGTREVVTKTLGLAQEGKLKAVIDPRGPFPFTTQGIRDAFHLQESRHTKGKVVIHVADK